MDACPFGRASAAIWASWEQNSKENTRFFKKTRDCQTIAGFLFLTQNQKRKEKHEHKSDTGADKVRP
jgi:hypothetical protein